MKIKLALLTVSIFYMTACTHTPSLGETMKNRSEETKKLGEQWTQGEANITASKKLEKRRTQLINSGNKKIKKGRQLISDGENEVTKGNQIREMSQAKMESGQRLQQESKSQFLERYPAN